MFFDSVDSLARTTVGCLNPFRTGRCFSTMAHHALKKVCLSQSLSNRAMFFDFILRAAAFLRLSSQSLSNRAMFFDIIMFGLNTAIRCLNPFRTGRCFSTAVRSVASATTAVSIPFEQGDVFRLQRYAGGRNHAAFQTHFPIFLEG